MVEGEKKEGIITTIVRKPSDKPEYGCVDSAVSLVHNPGIPDCHTQAAKEIVLSSLMNDSTASGILSAKHVNRVHKLYNTGVNSIQPSAHEGSNAQTVRNESVEDYRMIRRGLSDNVAAMKSRGKVKFIRQTSKPAGKPVKISQPTEYGHVYLNIYDLESVNKVVNVVAGTFGAGAYHAGVEIYGYEYNYGYTSLGGTGVMQSFPRFHPSHVYRKTIDLGKTRFSPREVNEIVERLKLQWPGNKYDLLKRNCLNFANAFCVELEVGEIPSWVMGLQNKINWTCDSFNSGAAKIKEFDRTVGISRAFGTLQRKLTGQSVTK
ncbi:hypothetical protein BEWA_042710 [Theileria equi strain WA]|uniref:PPPDE domain-containing protein n=1 Tax=Theileria equi strain WA TaxID=1537102 RepID=L1LGG8_THEEQ|nr:hypothetical protein BEWA_042710 [Theileria equi strain WA]EKX74233.1 hypothetical protein BEWA_042710 [Theileria equi strain WA]|eukprot:XP_004833685.1 hypothetical protein BEWA_042710 [Theileria equi strain WA]